eukprot:9167-Heterococcus_DN1.PRE.3
MSTLAEAARGSRGSAHKQQHFKQHISSWSLLTLEYMCYVSMLHTASSLHRQAPTVVLSSTVNHCRSAVNAHATQPNINLCSSLEQCTGLTTTNAP